MGSLQTMAPILKKIFIIIAILANSCISFSETTAEIDLKIQNIVDKNRLKYDLPALSLSIKLPEDKNIRNFASGYYTINEEKPITAETLFEVGSISKTFTATIILKLAEQGKINLDDSLEIWLPQYPRWKKVTIKNLLYHSSGIFNYTSGTYFDALLRKQSSYNWRLNELADIAYRHADLSSPGNAYHYSNTDYILLGLIIEKVANTTLEKVFDDYLKLYNLRNTFYYSPKNFEIFKIRLAHGYNRDKTFKFNTDVTQANLSLFQSAGALVSTTNDLIIWLSKLFSEQIINKKSLLEMTTIISEDNAKPINIHQIKPLKIPEHQSYLEIGGGMGMGLLYFKDSGPAWVHAGGTPGYEAFYAYNPCKDIYLALAYSTKPAQQLIFLKIANQIFELFDHLPDINKKDICLSFTAL